MSISTCEDCIDNSVGKLCLQRLILCLLGNFSYFLSSADFISKSSFSKNYFGITIGVSNSLDPDKARRFVGPGLDPNCLQRLSADATRRQRVNPPKLHTGTTTKSLSIAV